METSSPSVRDALFFRCFFRLILELGPAHGEAATRSVLEWVERSGSTMRLVLAVRVVSVHRNVATTGKAVGVRGIILGSGGLQSSTFERLVCENWGFSLQGGDWVHVHRGAKENFFWGGVSGKLAAPQADLVLRHEPAAFDHHGFILILEASLDLS